MSPFPSLGLLLRRGLWAVGVTCICFGCYERPAVAQDTPQLLATVLLDVADHFGEDLLFDPPIIPAHYVSPPKLGTTFEDEIRRLLDPHPLSLHRLTSGTYTIVEAALEPPLLSHITGLVLDATTGEPLPGAHVLLAEHPVGAVTDATGLFDLRNLNAGRYHVVASFIGYETARQTVDLIPTKSATVHLTLKPDPIRIAPLIVEDLDALIALQLAAQTISGNALSATMGLGTPDAVRSLGSLMGVRVGDALADVHIQGGESGEHQFRLDGVPVFDPVHLRGLLGAFNPFSLDQITVHKAGFGVTHGSHLSGVISARHMLAPADARQVDAQIDPLGVNMRLHARTGSASSRWSSVWMGAFRSSLWRLYEPPRLQNLFTEWNTPDLFLLNASIEAVRQVRPQLVPILEQQQQLNLATVSDPELGFSDVHVAGRLRGPNTQTLAWSFYRGANQLNANRLPFSAFELTADLPRDDTTQVINRDDYDWENTLGQLHYSRLLAPYALLSARLRGSHYELAHAYTGISYEGANRTIPGNNADLIVARIGQRFRPADDGNRLSEWALETKILTTQRARYQHQAGVELIRSAHRISVEDVYLAPIFDEGTYGRLAGFAESKWQLDPAWHFTLGHRATWLPARARVYYEPRAELQFSQATPRGQLVAARLAGGIYRQFTNQFDISSVSPSALLPSLRFWLPVDSTVAPPKAFHLAADVQWRPHPYWEVRAEAYLKDQPHVLQIDYPALWERFRTDSTRLRQAAFLRSGQGSASGGAVSVVFKTEWLRTSARYEMSQTQRTQFFGADTLSIRAPWNEPQRAALDLDVYPTRGLTLTLRSHAVWGRRWGFRQAYYDYFAADPTGAFVFGPFDLKDPDAHRLPALYQVDAGIAVSVPIGRTMLQVRGDVLNVLGRANVADWSLETIEEDGTIEYRKRPRYLLPRTPSLSARFKW
ncbi:MAG: carboxypeptidase-like regulatory domain-containing protein [Rhodothermales bacterium]